MKQKIVFILAMLSCHDAIAAMTSPNIHLKGGGDVLPTASMSIALNGLVPYATYNIVCYLTTNEPFEIVMMGSNFGTGNTGNIQSYNLNGITQVQGQLNTGSNTAVIVGNFSKPSAASVVFTNLDQDNSFNVNNCYAFPIVG